jgi:hypothetical protein
MLSAAVTCGINSAQHFRFNTQAQTWDPIPGSLKHAFACDVMAAGADLPPADLFDLNPPLPAKGFNLPGFQLRRG